MGSVGAVVVKRLDFLFLPIFLCTLSALRVEFVACSVGKKVHLWFAFDRYQPQDFRVKNNYL
jgi:hypothetical protein